MIYNYMIHLYNYKYGCMIICMCIHMYIYIPLYTMIYNGFNQQQMLVKTKHDLAKSVDFTNFASLGR